MPSNRLYSIIYKTVSRIPCGKVATYGQIARIAGIGKNARLVGYALSALSDQQNIPWHRVINARGEITYAPSRNDHDHLQKQLLLTEGVSFDSSERINLEKYGWNE